MEDITAVVVNGEEIGVREVLKNYRISRGAGFLEEIVQDALVRQGAKSLGLSVSDTELQSAADDFRKGAGLYDVEATDAWLKASGLGVDDLEAYLESQLLTAKVRDAVTDGQVDGFFSANRAAYDRAVVAHLWVTEEELAAELLAQINEEGADFATIASEYSQDPGTKKKGGFLGPVARADLSAPMEAAVFAASNGQVVGPIKTSVGWALVRVFCVTQADLDDGMRAGVKDTLFQQWRQEQRSGAKVEKPIADVV